MILIFSDIPGSEKAALEIENKIKKYNPELIILLGDILYHGPRNDIPLNYNPKEVIKVLSKYADKIIAVRGNCDAEVDQMVLPFSISNECSVIYYQGKKIYLTHGHIHSFANHPEGFDIVAQGHTHIPLLYKKEGTIYLNPGSTTIPKNGSLESFAILDKDKISIKSLFEDKLITDLEI